MTDDSLFQAAALHVLGLEGGWADDGVDRGGLTRYGISSRAHPDVDLAALTPEGAMAIYRRDYWDAAGCGRLPGWAAALLFDSRVQHSPGVGERCLQRACGAAADGVAGPATARALASVSDPGEALALALAHRAGHYRGIVARDPAQARFWNGWMKRLFLLHGWILGRCMDGGRHA